MLAEKQLCFFLNFRYCNTFIVYNLWSRIVLHRRRKRFSSVFKWRKLHRVQETILNELHAPLFDKSCSDT